MILWKNIFNNYKANKKIINIIKKKKKKIKEKIIISKEGKKK
jgi:hypothetical protein